MTDGEPTIGWTNFMFEPDPPNEIALPMPSPPAQPPVASAIDALHSPVVLGMIPPASLTPANDVLSSDAIYFGDGSYGEMGVSIMTVLTAAHRKREVLNSYFPPGTDPGQWDGFTPPSGQEQTQPDPSVGFYTIAFGSQPTQATRDLIRAT